MSNTTVRLRIVVLVSSVLSGCAFLLEQEAADLTRSAARAKVAAESAAAACGSEEARQAAARVSAAAGRATIAAQESSSANTPQGRADAVDKAARETDVAWEAAAEAAQVCSVALNISVPSAPGFIGFRQDIFGSQSSGAGGNRCPTRTRIGIAPGGIAGPPC